MTTIASHVRVRFPKESPVLTALREDDAPCVIAIVPASREVNTGADRALLMSAVIRCLESRRLMAVVGPRVELLKGWLSRQLSVSKKSVLFKADRYKISFSNGSEIVFSTDKKVANLAGRVYDEFLVVDAHEIEKSVADELDTLRKISGSIRVVSHPISASSRSWCMTSALLSMEVTDRSGVPGVSIHRLTYVVAVDSDLLAQSVVDQARLELDPSDFAHQYEAADPVDRVENLDYPEFAKVNLRIKTKDARIVPFVHNSIQQVYRRKKQEAIDAGKRPRFLALKYRQGGITTYEQGESYFLSSRRRNQNVVTFAQTIGKTAEIFEMVKLMYREDPHAPEKSGVGNAPRFEFPGLNSRFWISTAGSSAGGRGGTLQRVHWSEVAHSCKGPNQVDKQREVLTGFDEAAEHGEVVLESTPRGNELFKELYFGAKRGENDWTPIFLPWFDDPLNSDVLDPGEAESIEASLTEKESELRRMHGLSMSQIKWRRRKIRQYGPLFKQEHPEDDESCFLQRGFCYFDTDIIVDLIESIPDYQMKPQEGIEFYKIPGGTVTVWEQPKEGERYVCFSDTSEGNPTSDRNGFVIQKKSTGEDVAAVHGIWTPDILARLAVEWCVRYNRALLGVERNNHGHAVLLQITNLGYTTQNVELYYHWDNKPGWPTDNVTRPVMLSELEVDIRTGVFVPKNRSFLGECLTFCKQNDGKYSATRPDFDDLVMMYAGVRQMRHVRNAPTRVRTMSMNP